MSTIDRQAFFGAVLRAVACTRNHNEDLEEYAAGVLVPAARIREIEDELGEQDLPATTAEEVLSLLETVFRTKGTPGVEREFHIRHVTTVSGVAPAHASVAA